MHPVTFKRHSFLAIHAAVYNTFNTQRHPIRRPTLCLYDRDCYAARGTNYELPQARARRLTNDRFSLMSMRSMVRAPVVKAERF
jgi:hypothetical protein